MLLLIYVIVSSSYRVDEEYEYVGSGACHACHESEDCGNQTAVWMKGPHANAYRSLGSDIAKKHAKKILGKDVEPRENEFCLQCHENGCGVTDIDKLKKSYKKLLHPVVKKN